MKKILLSFFALLFLAPLVPAAGAQVVVRVGPRGHYHHRHCWYRHGYRHCR